jgi:hypothetical protein
MCRVMLSAIAIPFLAGSRFKDIYIRDMSVR